MKSHLIISVALLLSACAATVEVKPISRTATIQHVCILENPEAGDADILLLLRDGFDRNGISSEIYKESKPANCEYIVTYSTTYKWELLYGTYLRNAQIRIEKDGRFVATGHYHAGEGFVASKWRGSKAAIDPVIDEMLKK